MDSRITNEDVKKYVNALEKNCKYYQDLAIILENTLIELIEENKRLKLELNKGVKKKYG